MIFIEKVRHALLTQKILTEKEIEQYIQEAQNKDISLEEYLIQRELVPEDKLFQALAEEFHIPFVDLSAQTIDPKVLHLIPESIAQAHQVVAFQTTEKEIDVAVMDPDDIQTLDFIRKKTHLEPRPHLTTSRSLGAALKLYHRGIQEQLGTGGASRARRQEPVKPLDQLAEDLPVIRIVDTLLDQAIYEDASDIHLEPTDESVTVRFRVDGILHKVMTLPLETQHGVVARVKVLSKLKLDEHRLPQDGRFKINQNKVRMAVRVSIIPVYNGEKIVMRLLNESAQVLTLDGLGIVGKPLEILEKNIKKPNGIILVTGPTGSGKTTTLYTILNILNTSEVNISTIEDPIEYRIHGVNQSQVNPVIGFSFANGLRSLLRQDPNIIMVGEIRDPETAEIAAQSAMTGHLVLSTLHTNDAVTALPRLKDMRVEPFLIASTVNVVIAQRLVRKLCEKCKVEYDPSEEEQHGIKETLGVESIAAFASKESADPQKKSAVHLYRGKGCDECGGDGYKGRLGIYEILESTSEIREAMLQNKSTEQLREIAAKQGMRTMSEDGLLKALRGLTSIEEVFRVTKSDE
ncbi:MAG: Flp pilus assembly complex ATPase component TadA [Candidatus Kerfeldbacteria bacterium]|nr:Flp pilus assembly complex ATPase component TadA [Candidatus Kerfeldbacteria bacterium]